MSPLPTVDTEADFADVVSKARQITEPGVEVPEQAPGQRNLALITPGRMVMLFPVPDTPPTPEMVVAWRRFVPEDPPLQVTVIGRTDAVEQGALDVHGLNRLIPFTSFLLGLVHLGHNVIAFEGHPTAFATGCAGADLLIVHAPVADLLQPDWVQVAGAAMRRPRILLFLPNGDIAQVNLDAQGWLNPQPAPTPEPKPKRPWWRPF